MYFLGKLTLLIAAACTVGAHAAPQTSIPSCPAPFPQLLGDRVFEKYAVRGTGAAAVHPPNVKSGRARLYRTAIRNGAKQGPNFAGRYTIVGIGCGAATLCLAIVDAKTGSVFFPPQLNSAEALLVDTGKLNVETLNFRRNSRLLIVVGSPNEQPAKAGISYYLWQSGRLNLIRHTPAARLCGLPASTRF